jgi:hypothetical protein
MTGIWLVKTQGSEHVWDPDRWTYERRPGPGRSKFDGDNEAFPITDVRRWPCVGESFDVVFDWSLQDQWRISTAVRSIEPYAPDAAAVSGEQEERASE